MKQSQYIRRCVEVKAEVPWAAKVPRDWSQAGVTNRERGLDPFLIWAGRERQRPGGDKSGRRPTAFCYLIPERQAISIFFVQSLLFCIK